MMCRCGRLTWTTSVKPESVPGRVGLWWRLRNHRATAGGPWCETLWLPSERRKFIVVRPLPAMGLALGIKQLETRPMPPGGHASALPGEGYPGCPLEPGEDLTIVMKRQRPTKKLLAQWRELADHIDPRPTADDWPLGHAVCTVSYMGAGSLEGIGVGDSLSVYNDDGTYWRYIINATEYALGEWGDDRWGWGTYNVRRLETPVPVAGQQGIQRMTEAETAAVQEQLDQLPF